MRTVEGQEIRGFLGRFKDLYNQHRFGAIYLIRRPKDPVLIKLLLQDYPPDRLEKIVVELLTTKEEWISKTDRGIGILAVKASWLDGVLCERAAKAQQGEPKPGAYQTYVPFRLRKEA